MSSLDLLSKTASQLAQAKNNLPNQQALLGFDGFVDEIIRVVDKRHALNKYSPIPTLTAFAKRVAQAAGKSANIELIVQKLKLGGNGPIMANALAIFGLRVNYIGNLGYPTLHPVFEEFARRANVFSIANPCHTEALEFEDGKLMLGKLEALHEVTWNNLLRGVGEERFLRFLSDSHLIGLLNWTMIPHMSEIWKEILHLCPALPASCKNHFIFFDLADPVKRLTEDLREALALITQFQYYFQVILGLNEKEGQTVAKALGIESVDATAEQMLITAQKIRSKMNLHTVVIHPVQYAVAASKDDATLVEGPFDPKPYISTGAGDHFNAGYCLGQLLGFDLETSLLTGVASSGFYVRSAQSPTIEELIKFLKNWPVSIKDTF
ncbi:MAG: carbohydrate kinase family protein [candidate division KSB1 bacterium]|nr:carbohydrate kinase family protein [candidate division KSB1 bacterium]